MYKEIKLTEEELTKQQEELQYMMQDSKGHIDVKRCSDVVYTIRNNA